MRGPGLAKLAWRNIWRNRRRTIITLMSIAFGTLLAVVMTGIGDSSWKEMIDHAARLGGGHVIVQHRDYLARPSLKKTVRLDPAEIEILKSEPEIRTFVPRISGGVMLSTSTNNVGAAVLGVDPKLEDETTLGLVDAIVEGEMFADRDATGIIVGRTLAENLDLEMGKKVVYTVTDKSGDIATGLARVSGIIETGAVEVDAGTCILPLGTLQRVLGYAPDEFTQVAIFVDDHRVSEDLARRLSERLSTVAGPDATVLPWFVVQSDLAGFVSLKVYGALVFELIITVLVAAGIFNTLFVSVMERIRELGILAAIGFSSIQLFGLVLWESFWLGVCGIVAGVLLTAGPYYYLSTTGIDTTQLYEQGAQISGISMDPILYVQLYPSHGWIIAGAIVAATMAAGVYPAIKAGRVSPVETIRIV
jgi:ABC-type lipoprotein release transport system permease subunit